MKPIVEFTRPDWERLQQHLFAPPARLEQAAFAFAAPDTSARDRLRVVDLHLVRADELEVQLAYHLELREETWRAVIQRAHRSGHAVVEMHSHIGGWPAAFSASDLDGLADTSAHVAWRLKGRPFAAVVFARDSLDGMFWAPGVASPEQLHGVFDGSVLHSATGLTAGRRHANS